MRVPGHAKRQTVEIQAVTIDEDTVGVAVASERALDRDSVRDGVVFRLPDACLHSHN